MFHRTTYKPKWAQCQRVIVNLAYIIYLNTYCCSYMYISRDLNDTILMKFCICNKFIRTQSKTRNIDRTQWFKNNLFHPSILLNSNLKKWNECLDDVDWFWHVIYHQITNTIVEPLIRHTNCFKCKSSSNRHGKCNKQHSGFSNIPCCIYTWHHMHFCIKQKYEKMQLV